MEKRLMMFIAGLFLSMGVALAQTQVNGTVTSADDGEPVIGASVLVEGTKTGTVTDINGNFSISVPAGKKLVISYLGMQTQTVSAKPGMRIELAADSQTLEDLVVVGYGTGRKVGTVIGSVSTVGSDKLKNAPSASVLDALQGQVAGLSVLSSSGVAGDNATSITLHGVGSLGSSSEPLYVIDGIPSTSRTLMAMNPNDIQSVSVLKDASATSIYGSRAANGVIYVTTKGGSYNSKATVTFRTQYGWSTLADKGLYENMMSGDELYNFWLDSGFADYYMGGDGAAYLKETYDDQGYRYNTKWYEIFQQFNNPQTQNDITFEGGSDRMSYMVSASQFHQRGTSIGNVYDRYTVRTNLNGRPKDWLKFGINLNLSYDKNEQNANWGNSSGPSNYIAGGLSYLLNPLYPSHDPETGEPLHYFPFGMYDPQYMADSRPDTYSRYFMNGNFFVSLTPIKGLTITSRIGTDMIFTRRNANAFPSSDLYGGSGSRLKASAYQYTHTITNTAEYRFSIAEDNHFTVLLGQEGTDSNYDYFSASSSGQYDDRLMNLQNGTQASYAMTEDATASKFLSFFGRIDYDWAEKYFVDFSLRTDGSSRFSKDNRWGTFWAAGAMWKAKKEKFLKDVKWLDDLSLKVSYGTQGNASIGDYTWLRMYGINTSYGDNPALHMTQALNDDLTWEKQQLFTVGLSGRVLDMIDFEIQYYNRQTKDMLMAVPYPYTTGFSSLYRNVGGMENQGIDINLGVDILKHKDYFLRFSTNFNYNSQKITELFDGRDRWVVANTLVAYVVGDPVSYYMPIYAGVDPEDGAPMWYKAGENVDDKTCVETTKNYDEAALTQNTGKKRYAPINGGFSLSGGWKGLTLQADFSYVIGKYMVNNDAYFYNNPMQGGLDYNQSKDVLNYWTPENPNAAFPDWSQGYVMQFDTHLLENASFLRLKNLQIGYELPKQWLNFQNVLQNVKITFTGRNLLTVTSYGGIDPEVDSNLTYGIAGNSKQYLFGLELTF